MFELLIPVRLPVMLLCWLVAASALEADVVERWVTCFSLDEVHLEGSSYSPLIHLLEILNIPHSKSVVQT